MHSVGVDEDDDPPQTTVWVPQWSGRECEVCVSREECEVCISREV